MLRDIVETHAQMMFAISPQQSQSSEILVLQEARCRPGVQVYAARADLPWGSTGETFGMQTTNK